MHVMEMLWGALVSDIVPLAGHVGPDAMILHHNLLSECGSLALSMDWCTFQCVVIEQLLDEVYVCQDHAPAAVSRETQSVQSLSAHSKDITQAFDRASSARDDIARQF